MTQGPESLLPRARLSRNRERHRGVAARLNEAQGLAVLT